MARKSAVRKARAIATDAIAAKPNDAGGEAAAPEPEAAETPLPPPPPEPGDSKPEGRRGRSRDPRVFVLLRELSEVHLLLDNVSANPNTTVAELGTRTPPKGLNENWIERVCEISWPPDGSDEEKAGDAALLIRAKDYLNRLSHPASGSTIAFTLLVTQGDSPKWWTRWFSFWRRSGGDDAGQPASPTRSSLAQTAYPDLVSKAVGFRRAMWWICLALILALFLTCAISWYVAYGNAALAELATARTALNKAQDRVDEAEGAEVPGPPRDGRTAVSAPAVSPAVSPTASGAVSPPALPPAPFVSYCTRNPYLNAAHAQLCEEREMARIDISLVERRLANWLCFDWFSDCTNQVKIEDAASRAAAFATIMGSAVLPFLYGLLGAGAAIIRSLSRKIRSSLLSPRDLHLSIQQLALGAVVGACIGLFVSAPGSEGSGENLLGPVTLSASAISFVAGFGVEAVFQALETLITRIFNISPAAPSGNRGDGLPGN